MITSRNARIETPSTSFKDEHTAYLGVSEGMNGYAAVIRFAPSLGGHYVLATRVNDQHGLFLVAIPGVRWLGDLRDDGYTVIQTLTLPLAQQTAERKG